MTQNTQPLMVVAQTDYAYACVVTSDQRHYDKGHNWQRLAARHLRDGGRVLHLRSRKHNHRVDDVFDELASIRDGDNPEALDYLIVGDYKNLDAFLDDNA